VNLLKKNWTSSFFDSN